MIIIFLSNSSATKALRHQDYNIILNVQYRPYLQLFSSLFDKALKLKLFCALVAELVRFIVKAYIDMFANCWSCH
jgi:hypothetical protein